MNSVRQWWENKAEERSNDVNVQYHLSLLPSVSPGNLSTFPLSTLCLALAELIDSLYVNLSQTWVAAINEGGICQPDSEVRAHGRVIYCLRQSLEADAGVVWSWAAITFQEGIHCELRMNPFSQ